MQRVSLIIAAASLTVLILAALIGTASAGCKFTHLQGLNKTLIDCSDGRTGTIEHVPSLRMDVGSGSFFEKDPCP